MGRFWLAMKNEIFDISRRFSLCVKLSSSFMACARECQTENFPDEWSFLHASSDSSLSRFVPTYKYISCEIWKFFSELKSSSDTQHCKKWICQIHIWLRRGVMRDNFPHFRIPHFHFIFIFCCHHHQQHRYPSSHLHTQHTLSRRPADIFPLRFNRHENLESCQHERERVSSNDTTQPTKLRKGDEKFK